MPSFYDSEYFAKHCFVSYRASHNPQVVCIRARWEGVTRRTACDVSRLLHRNEESMREGFAADGHFSPLDAEAEFFDVPDLSDSSKPLPQLDVKLRVRSVSEWFLRYLVAVLAPHHVELSIQGELALDGGPDCLDTARFVSKNGDPTAHPGAWPDVPFEFDVGEASRGASLRIDFGGEVPKDYATGPRGIGVRAPRLAGMMTLTFRDRSGEQAAALDLMPRIKIGKREVSVNWNNFAVQFEPFTNILLNHLIWVHHREIPIEKVQLRLS